MAATIDAEYITPEQPAPGGTESGLYIFANNPHESESYACNSSMADPVRTADGRWHMACHIEASPLRRAPEAIELTIVRYGDGEEQLVGKATLELTDAAE